MRKLTHKLLHLPQHLQGVVPMEVDAFKTKPRPRLTTEERKRRFDNKSLPLLRQPWARRICLPDCSQEEWQNYREGSCCQLWTLWRVLPLFRGKREEGVQVSDLGTLGSTLSSVSIPLMAPLHSRLSDGSWNMRPLPSPSFQLSSHVASDNFVTSPFLYFSFTFFSKQKTRKNIRSSRLWRYQFCDF